MLIDIYPKSLEAICQSLGIQRSISQEERDQIDDSDFAGPHQSFPIDSQDHLDAAAHLIGHADDPEAVKKKAIEIAKRKGFKLPKAWQEDEGGESQESQERSVEVPGVIQTSDRPSMSLPLVRIDTAKREVWGQATAEVPDSYGTIFGYYPEAWKTWRGNVREQHDGKKAVGRRVELECNDQERAIYVGTRVSRGAQDTWLKVEDNVLTGYSASIIPDPEFGPDPKRWPKKEYNGKQYPYLPRYTVAELSLVDNPACPGCNIQIVRADGFATEVLDLSEEEEPEQPAIPEPAQEPHTLERAGARLSGGTKGMMHTSIGHTLHAVAAQMQNCGCPDCQAAMRMIDPDQDGDVDLGGYDDPDHDWQALYNPQQNTNNDLERVVTGIVERALQPVFTRLQGIAGTLARSNAPSTNTASLESIVSGAITRAVEAANAAHESSLAEVRASLGAVKEQVDAIANTPMPGAPIMNAGALPRPVEKRLPTDPPYEAPRRSGSSVFDAVAALSNAGQLNTVDKQVDAVAAALAAQRRG